MLITLSKFSIFWGFMARKVQIERHSYPQTVDNLKTNTPRGTIQTHMKKGRKRGKRKSGKKKKKRERGMEGKRKRGKRKERGRKKEKEKKERLASLGRDDRDKCKM